MLINYLPYFMADIKEMQKIMEVSEPEMDKIDTEIDILLKNMFVLHTDKKGIERFEDMLDVVPKLTDSHTKRQADILAIYTKILPFTIHNLKNMLNALCGEDGYYMELIYERYLLIVKLALKNKPIEQSIFNMLDDIVPMNLNLRVSIDYNTWEDMRVYNWLEVKKYSWINIKESEEIKNGK